MEHMKASEDCGSHDPYTVQVCGSMPIWSIKDSGRTTVHGSLHHDCMQASNTDFAMAVISGGLTDSRL